MKKSPEPGWSWEWWRGCWEFGRSGPRNLFEDLAARASALLFTVPSRLRLSCCLDGSSRGVM